MKPCGQVKWPHRLPGAVRGQSFSQALAASPSTHPAVVTGAPPPQAAQPACRQLSLPESKFLTSRAPAPRTSAGPTTGIYLGLSLRLRSSCACQGSPQISEGSRGHSWVPQTESLVSTSHPSCGRVLSFTPIALASAVRVAARSSSSPVRRGEARGLRTWGWKAQCPSPRKH